MTIYDSPKIWNQVNGTNPVTGYPITSNHNVPEIFAQAMSYEEKITIVGIWVARLKSVVEELINTTNDALQDVTDQLNRLVDQIHQWQLTMNEWQTIMDNWQSIMDGWETTINNIIATAGKKNTLELTGDVTGSATENASGLLAVTTRLSQDLRDDIANAGAKTVQLTGDVTGSGTVDSSGKITIATTADLSVDVGWDDSYDGIVNGPSLGSEQFAFLGSVFFATGHVQVTIAAGDLTRDTVQPDGSYSIDAASISELICTLKGIKFVEQGGAPVNVAQTVYSCSQTVPWGDGSVAIIDIDTMIEIVGNDSIVTANVRGVSVDGATTPTTANTFIARLDCPFVVIHNTDKSLS